MIAKLFNKVSNCFNSHAQAQAHACCAQRGSGKLKPFEPFFNLKLAWSSTQCQFDNVSHKIELAYDDARILNDFYQLTKTRSDKEGKLTRSHWKI